MMKKPRLSFWQIWNLSFGFLGVQIGYSLQNSNTSTIFESLGADLSHLSYFWLAAPVAGLVIQPIVGLFSDGTWTRWGRRIPFILRNLRGKPVQLRTIQRSCFKNRLLIACKK